MSKRPLTLAAWGLGLLVMAAPTVIALRLTSSKSGAPSTPSTAAPVADASHSAPPQASAPAAVTSHSVHVNAQIESWAQAFHGHTYDIPRQLRDGHWFEPAAVIGPAAVVGTIQANAGDSPRSGAYGVVIIDPATARVTNTIAMGTNTAADQGADQIDVVSAAGANTDWVTWLHGHQGDGNGFDHATIYAQDLKTGRRLVLGTATMGDSSQLTPTISGDDVMWADPRAVHVYSLSKHASAYTLPLTNATSTSTSVDAFHWPWLSYQVRPVVDGPSVSHVVDVRSGADDVVSGPCDGTWCATTTPGAGASDTVGAADAVGLVAQGIASESRTIATNLGGFGGVAAVTNGFVLWTDDDPYVPGAGATPDASPTSTLHTYLYDIAADRDIEMPGSRTDFISGSYVVWADGSTAGGALHFAALADIG